MRRETEFGQQAAPGQFKLEVDEVDAEDLLGHRVLDLQARVCLDEEEPRFRTLSVAGLDQELEGAEVAVGRCGSEGERCITDRVAQRRWQAGRGRDLDQLLVAPLEAAVPVAEVDDGSALVAGDLDLHMADRCEQLLDEDAIVVECGSGFGNRPAVRILEFVFAGHHPHAAAAAAPDGLDQHRGAWGQVVHERPGLVQGDRLGDPGHDRNAVLLRERPGPRLVAEQLQCFGRRADETDARVEAATGETGVLAQKAVARMDRVAFVLGGGPQQLLSVEVGGGAGAVERRRFVRPADMERLVVVLGVHRHGGDVEFRRGSGDAYRDLAAVGYQQLHRPSFLRAERAPLLGRAAILRARAVAAPHLKPEKSPSP